MPSFDGFNEQSGPLRAAAKRLEFTILEVFVQARVNLQQAFGNSQFREVLQGGQSSLSDLFGFGFSQEVQEQWRGIGSAGLPQNLDQAFGDGFASGCVLKQTYGSVPSRAVSEPQTQADVNEVFRVLGPGFGKPIL